MQFLKTKLFGLLILLCGAMPLQGMLTTTNKMHQNVGKLKYMQQRFQPNKPQQINIPINKPIKTPQRSIQAQTPPPSQTSKYVALAPWLNNKFFGIKSNLYNYWNEFSVFTYKNVWSNFEFNGEATKQLLSNTWKANPQLAENLGMFVFHRLSKKQYITYPMGLCLVEIIKIFLMNGKDIPDDLLEFTVLNDSYAVIHFNGMKIALLWEMLYSGGSENSKKGEELLKTKFFPLLIHVLKKHKEYKERIYMRSEAKLEHLMDLFEGIDDEGFIELIFGINKMDSQTPSYRHLYKEYVRSHSAWPTLKDTFKEIIVEVDFTHMVPQIIHKEKELIDSGYEVFYHGRRWKYGFLSDIYSMLYTYKSGKELKDFIFTQLDDPVLGKVSDTFYESESVKRERLLLEGNPSPQQIPTHPLDVSNRQSLLFLNKFLFGNMDKLGSSSIYYIFLNKNVGDISFSMKEIFNMFGYSDVYSVFEQELFNVLKEYNSLTRYGEMLQIAVPKENVDQCIYYTTSGGSKKTFFTEADEPTTDINVILKDIDKNPRDIVEFALIETHDKFGGLNPDSGIKVFSYNLVNPDKMAAFKEKENALFARIIQSLEQEATIKQEKEQEKKVYQQARE